MTIETIARYVERWSLTLEGEPFSSYASTLAFVRCDGMPAVLKVPQAGSEELLNPLALAHYGERAVRVFRQDDEAFVMERANPGTELKTLSLSGRDDEATRIAADTMLAIHAHPAPPGPWKSLDDLAQGFARYRTGPAHPLLDPGLVERAEKTFLDLCATQSVPHLLLHGDLHHMNILKDDARGWLVIDPKGVTGELAYETAAILHNPIPHFEMIADTKIMEARVRIFSDRLKISAERILGWCFAKNVLGHLWTVEDRHDDSKFPRSLRVAQTALDLLGNPTP